MKLKAAFVGVISVAALAGCGGKKGSGSAFGPDQPAVEPETPAPQPASPPVVDEGKPTLAKGQVRQLTSVVGRTVAGYGTDNETTPLPGVRVYGYVDKKIIESISDDSGFFFFKDVPVLSESGDNPTGSNLTLYVEKEGWELAGDDQHGSVNSFAVQVTASPESPSAYQIDVGPKRLVEQLLKVTSSLHHASRDAASRWLISGQSVGAEAEINGGGDQQLDVYLAVPGANITLTFNRPVDTGYSDDRDGNRLLEFYDPQGKPVAYTGAWDATKTIFTINPGADLTPDNDDETMYRIVIARPVRAFAKESGALHELRDVTIYFNVLASDSGALLASQAPGFYPQAENRTAYVFDSEQLYEKALQAGTTVTDFVTPAGADNFYLKWAAVAGAKGYNLYWRNLFHHKNGAWTKHNSALITPYGAESLPDASFSYEVADFYSSGGTPLTVDGVLVAGEQVQFVVTSIDQDNNESSINTVTAPLAVSDTFKPYVASASNSATTATAARPEAIGPAVNRALTLTFNEYMDSAAANKPAFTAASGLVTASASNGHWLSRTVFKTDVALTFERPEATLTRAAFATDTRIAIDLAASNSGFAVGDVIAIKPTNESDVDDTVTATITAVDTQSNRLTLSGAVGEDFPIGSKVRLQTKAAVPGLTAVHSAVVGDHFNGAKTVTITSGSGVRFRKGQTVQFVVPDEEGYVSVGTAAIEDPGDTLELTSATSPIQFDIPSGALVVDSGLSLAELEPRAPETFTISNNPLFDDHAADLAILSDNFAAAPDAQLDKIIVSNIDKFAVNDFVVITKSTNSKTLTSDMTALSNLDVTAHGFQEGDTVLIEGEYVSRSVAASVDSSATFTVSSAFPVMQGEVLQVVDPAFRTALTQATTGGGDPGDAGAGDTTLVVQSDLGFAKDMTINIDDGVNTTTGTVASVAGGVITLTGAIGTTHTFPVGTRISRAKIGPTNGTVSASSTGTTIVFTGAIGDWSRTAQIIANRASEKLVVGDVDDPNVLPVTASVRKRAGTTISLWSFDETRRIIAIDRDRYTLQLDSALAHSHRKDAKVQKSRQDWLTLATNQAAVFGKVVMGDVIVINTLAVGTADAHADRVFAVVNGIDSANNRLRVAITKNDLTFGSTATFTYLGDAVSVATVPDANGNSLQTYLNRVNLNDGTVR